jgi:hypothetical protein
VFLEREHENDLTLRWETIAGSAASGANFLSASGDMFWAAGDNTPQFVTIFTTRIAGCNSDKTMSLRLSAVSGGSVLSNRGAIMDTVGTITDTDGSTVSVSAPGFVAAGSVMPISALVSSTCDFPIIVPVRLTGADQGIDYVVRPLRCTIAAFSSSCVIPVTTTPTADADFSVVVDATAFNAANPVFGSKTISAVPTTGTIRIFVAPPADGAVAAARACGSDNNNILNVDIADDSDMTQVRTISDCFTGDDLTYIVTRSEGLATARMTGAELTISALVTGTSVFTVTASGPTSVASITINVLSSTLSKFRLSVLSATGVTLKRGQYFQTLVSNVPNDDARGNIEACSLEGRVPNVALNDCCVITGASVMSSTCERVASLALRTTVIESVKVSLRGDVVGTSSVCLGNRIVPESSVNFCFDVTVTA